MQRNTWSEVPSTTSRIAFAPMANETRTACAMALHGGCTANAPHAFRIAIKGDSAGALIEPSKERTTARRRHGTVKQEDHGGL